MFQEISTVHSLTFLSVVSGNLLLLWSLSVVRVLPELH
jgi:hypothetical protein